MGTREAPGYTRRDGSVTRSMVDGSAHRFFICLADGTAPVPWSPSDPQQRVRLDCVYFGRALVAARDRLPERALSFYLTWDLEELPEYGDHVVALVLGDEDARVPRYVCRVRAVFKCYGSRPFVGMSPLLPPSRSTMLVALQAVRRWLRHLPDDIRLLVHGPCARRSAIAAIRPIPLGYYNQLDMPLSDFGSRRTAVFFAGSLEHSTRRAWSPARWFGQPAPVMRQEMVDALERFGRERPDQPVNLRLTSGFGSHRRSDAEAYSRDLMDAKICLAPRGGSVETYRYVEALRYGCVVISEPLPPTWFYRDSPVVVIQRWRDLPGILSALLDDPVGLTQRHEAALAWWRERCSEDALGAYLAEQLLH